MPLVLRRWLPIALIALVALWLRTRDLAARPMHSDEANQAVKFGQLLETGRYTYDPHDHHGPTLYYAALPVAWFRGQRTLAALDETTVRLVPALFGTAAVILLYLLALPYGGATPSARIFPLLAAAFLAVSPPAVYYSRYFIQETLLLAFVLAAFVCAQRWWRHRSIPWAVAAGICAGLAEATKVSAPLFLIAAALAALGFAIPLARGADLDPPIADRRRVIPHFAFAFVAAVATAAILFSSFGTNPSGLHDALAAYGFGAHRLGSGDTGHEKPLWYYLRLFAWQRDGGLLFQQLPFTVLALAGAALAVFLRRPAPAPAPPIAQCHIMYDSCPGASASAPLAISRPLRWAALYTLVIAAVLSLTPYKTPWHAIHFVPGLALLAAGALAALPKLSLSLPLAALALAFQLQQTNLATLLRPADARNPYAYVHSSPDVLQFRGRADAALAHSPDGVIRVISEEYWPLPWYFRGLPRVGYWTSPPSDCDGALVITSAILAPEVRSRLRGHYHETLLGLRPGFLCVVFTPRP